MCAYTCAGAITSAAIGFSLSELGRWCIPRSVGHALTLVGLPVAGVLFAAREIGWIRFPVPERKLQTEQTWFHDFGIVPAAAMWGIHIGMGFTTRITFMGFWLLVGAVVVLANGWWGAALFAGYWVGRALPVWLVPLLGIRREDNVGLTVMNQALGARYLFERVRAAADVWLAIVFLEIGRRLPISS